MRALVESRRVASRSYRHAPPGYGAAPRRRDDAARRVARAGRGPARHSRRRVRRRRQRVRRTTSAAYRPDVPILHDRARARAGRRDGAPLRAARPGAGPRHVAGSRPCSCGCTSSTSTRTRSSSGRRSPPSSPGFVLDPTGTAGGFEGTTTTASCTRGLEPGTLKVLPPGYDIKFSDPAEIGDAVPFLQLQLRSIAAGLGVPEYLLTGDLSQANYSSLRAALVEFRTRLEQLQYQRDRLPVLPPDLARVDADRSARRPPRRRPRRAARRRVDHAGATVGRPAEGRRGRAPQLVARAHEPPPRSSPRRAGTSSSSTPRSPPTKSARTAARPVVPASRHPSLRPAPRPRGAGCRLKHGNAA